MNVLHITNGYAGSAVYKNLCLAEDQLNIKQTIYCGVRSKYLIDKNKVSFPTIPQSKIIYSKVLNIYTRINFYYKSKKIYSDILNKVGNFSDIDIIHAHTWYSDGVIAYNLHKQYNIPYIVTIRNTDLNIFFKYMLHLRSLGLEILLNAKKIIFISEIYKTRFIQNNFYIKSADLLKNKLEVIPNGIAPFWVSNTTIRKATISSPVKLIYIGNFTPNKNVKRLVKSIELLRKDGFNILLDIIGGSSDITGVGKYIRKKEFITYHGRISDEVKLKDFLRKSDIFVMPSITETFGLVYVEALSQGIPILYTKGEGIDGFYDNNIGEGVIAKDIFSIKNGIKEIITNYERYNFIPREITENHIWINIAHKYLNIYKEGSTI